MKTTSFSIALLAASLLSSQITAQILWPAQTLSNLPGSYKPVIADLNHDGVQDLAIGAESGTTQVHVLLGNGTGGFSAPTTPNANHGQTLGLAVADLNGDRNLDLIATGAGAPSYVVVFLGNGAGSFAAGVPFATGGSSAVDVAVGDLNLDAKPDAVVANKSGLTIHLGDGLGGFAAPTPATAGSSVGGVVLADLNGDGFLDVATANTGSNNVSVLLGAGPAGLLPKTDYATGVGPLRIAVADLDRDGRLDLVVANNGNSTVASSTVSILWGTGAGAFSPAQTVVTGNSAANERARSVAVGDLDADGVPDLVVGNGDANTISVVRGLGARAFAIENVYPVGGGSQGVAVADLNRDGLPDVISANSRASNSSVLLSQLTVPIGISSYGTGTPGCEGTMTMCASGIPKVGTAGFVLTCANTPPSAPGVLLLGLPKDVAGYNFGFGFLVHVGPALLLTVPFPSAGGGSAATPLPIPNDPNLVNFSLFFQGGFLAPLAHGGSCSLAPIVTSRGLAVVVQP